MKYFAIVTLFVMLAGCASLSYKTPDGTEVRYTRLFTTSDSIKGTVGEAKVQFTNQQIDTEAVTALLNLLGVIQAGAK